MLTILVVPKFREKLAGVQYRPCKQELFLNSPQTTNTTGKSFCRSVQQFQMRALCCPTVDANRRLSMLREVKKNSVFIG